MNLFRPLLALFVALATLAPASVAEAARPAKPVAHHHTAKPQARPAARSRAHHRAPSRRYRYRRRPSRRRAPPRATYHPLEQGAGPVYLGDLYISSSNTPLWSRPVAGAQALARLPKDTIVTNMGRVAVSRPDGRVIAYYYKVEAPNGAVGYVNPRYLSPQPPAW